MSKSKLKALSTLCGNFSEVFLGSLVIPAFIGEFNISRIPVLLLGLLLMIASVILSLQFAEKGGL